MTPRGSAIYAGEVVHQRVTPRRHRLAYRVFSLCLDVDEIDDLARSISMFSRNRFNAVSFHDRDHGAGDGTPVGVHVRAILTSAGLEDAGAKVQLLCYPRLFGYVFNPLSVYFCRDSRGRLGAVIYEVNNTFSERKSYVIPVSDDAATDGVVRQSCPKEMYVSPFTQQAGRYGFSIRPPGDDVLIGITFRDANGPVLNARFAGKREPLTRRALAGALVRFPLMTLKVAGGIHLEAARLWAKGVPLVTRHSSPPYSFTVVGALPAASTPQILDAQ